MYEPPLTRLYRDTRAPVAGVLCLALETKNQYGGTSLSGALWGALNTPESGDYVAVIESLLAARARIEPGMTEWWKQEASSMPTYARILQLLETHVHES